MTKKTKNNAASDQKGFKKPKAFRMAYSLNNYQPVACTMISDQPFFYMDEEVLMDEDALLAEEGSSEFTDQGFDLLESEVAKLKTKMDAYDRVSAEFVQPDNQRLEMFIEDSMVLGARLKTPNEHNSIEKLKEAINESRMATSLLDFAEKHDVSLSYSDQIDTVSYDKKSGEILIRNDIDFADQVLLTVQELRRHWQHRQGALVHPLTFHPDQAILINRAQLADLSVAVVRAAWEMKLQNKTEFWARIENSSMADLGRALAREALSDFRTLNNGKASAAAFETWFLSERCRHQDKKLIQSMLADYRGYVFDSSEASKMVSIDLVCALGEQTFGKNYLAPYAQMILNDPIFTDVRDRSNANFLWFIKFERSFIETEQELQSSHVINKSDPSSFEDQTVNNDIIEDNQYEKQRSGDHVQAGRDNIVHVQFGAGSKSNEGILS